MNGFWWLFFYALSSGILVTTLLPLNITIIKEFNLLWKEFWWLFFYALSSGILVTTLLPLNIIIIKEFNLL